jgi:hypothetical protein
MWSLRLFEAQRKLVRSQQAAPSICGLLEEYVWPSKPKDAGSMPVARSNFVPRWCNGNTTDFDSVVPGSSPGRGANNIFPLNRSGPRYWSLKSGITRFES